MPQKARPEEVIRPEEIDEVIRPEEADFLRPPGGPVGLSRGRTVLERILGFIPALPALLGKGPAMGALTGAVSESARQILAGATAPFEPGIAAETRRFAGGKGGGQMVTEPAFSPAMAFGRPEPSAGQAALKIAKEAALGATFGAAAAIPGKLARTMSPKQQEAQALFQKLGIEPTAADIGTQATKITQTLASGTLRGAGVIERARTAQAAGLKTSKDKLLTALGPSASPLEAGESLKYALRANDELLLGGKNLPGLFSEAYNRLTTKVGGARINASVYQDTARQVSQDIQSVAKGIDADKPGISGAIRQAIDNAQNFGRHPQTGQFRPVTFNEAKNLRTELMDMKSVTPATLPGRKAAAALSRLIGSIDDAMEQAATKAGPGALTDWRALNQAYKEAHELLRGRSLAARVIREEVPASAAVMQGKAVPERAIELFQGISGEVFSNPQAAAKLGLTSGLVVGGKLNIAIVRRQIANDLMESSTRFTTDGQQIISGPSLQTRWRKLAPEVKDRFFTKTHQQDIEDIGKMATILGPEIIVPAMGRQLLAAGQITKLSQVITSPRAFLTIVAPGTMAKIMVNPKGARVMAEGLRLKPGTKEFLSWLPRAANVAWMAESAPTGGRIEMLKLEENE